MKRIIFHRKRTTEEGAELRAIRAEIEAELPELIAEHHEVMARRELFAQLQAAQAAKGLTLAELPGLSDQSQGGPRRRRRPTERWTCPSKLLRRYARAVGKRLVLAVADA